MAASGGISHLVLVLLLVGIAGKVGALWCVSRSNISQKQLQTALDYACGAGADCAPIQSSGLCFLPNTLESHASYAFNSYYQRKNNAPGSCDFSGSATIATTNPSYGSCTYPDSPSSAGGTPNTPSPPTVPGTPGTITPVLPSLPGTITPVLPSPPGTITPVLPSPPGLGLTPGLSPGTLGLDGSASSPLPYSVSMIFSCLFTSYLLHLF